MCTYAILSSVTFRNYLYNRLGNLDFVTIILCRSSPPSPTAATARSRHHPRHDRVHRGPVPEPRPLPARGPEVATIFKGLRVGNDPTRDLARPAAAALYPHTWRHVHHLCQLPRPRTGTAAVVKDPGLPGRPRPPPPWLHFKTAAFMMNTI